MSRVTYRYWCTTEADWVDETRLATDPVPLLCKNDAFPIVAGTLAIVGYPEELGDIEFRSGASADFTNAVVSGMSHDSLDDVGVNTHAHIDAHLADASLHRTIDDGASGTTDLWSASKIAGELAAKSSTSHTRVADDVTDFAAAADARITAQKGVANGIATLDGTAKIPASQLPAAATPSVTVVADIAGRDALVPQEGDVTRVTDADGNGNARTYVYDGASWLNMHATGDVTSVNGQSGAVSLSTTHVDEGDNLYHTEARVTANVDVAANSAHRIATDNPHNVTAAQVGLGDVANVKVNLAASVAPATTDDGSSGYAVGSRWVNVAGEREFVCVDATQNSAVWKETTAPIIEQVHIGYVTNSSTYVTPLTGTYLYRGASLGGIKSIKVVAAHLGTLLGHTFDVRVIDYDNEGAVIAEATGMSGTTKKIWDLGPVSNVPTADHIFEVQVRRSGIVLLNFPATIYTLAFEFY